MIKKLIPISVILTLAVMFGLVGVANAGNGNDVYFTENTPIGIGDVMIAINSKVETIAIGTNSVVMTLGTTGATSRITFTSATGRIMNLNYPDIATSVCNAGGDSYLTVPYDATHHTDVTMTVSAATCGGGTAPTIDSVIVKSATTVEVTFSDNVKYTGTSSAALCAAATRFAGLTPTTSAISGRTLTLTFTAGALAGAAVKDSSVLSLPTAHIEAVTGLVDFAGTTTQVVTTLSSINQLYDFVFMIQSGQNFMSIPYDVTTTLANSYVDPGTATISIQTIGDAGGNFANASSYSVLYGYYINSSGATDVYLRLKKTAATFQSPTFSRTFTATGWHLIGVASNNVATAITSDTDDDVLYGELGASSYGEYSEVVDIAVGRTGDDNANAYPDYTYDATVSCYKALLNNLYIATKTKTQIDDTFAVKVNAAGIEFNHGEAYFIWINTQNARYIGQKVSGTATSGNLIKQLRIIKIE